MFLFDSSLTCHQQSLLTSTPEFAGGTGYQGAAARLLRLAPQQEVVHAAGGASSSSSSGGSVGTLSTAA